MVLVLSGVGITAATLMSLTRSTHGIRPQMTQPVARGELVVTVTEQGTLESSDNTEIKCKVRGSNTVIWVVESGTVVNPGDELVRLDTLSIEEEISERVKYAHLSKSGAERSKANVARAKLAISEYEEGRYVSQLSTLQKDLAVAESTLRTAQNMLSHTQMMAENGYVSDLILEEREFAVTRAKLNVEYIKTEIEVLQQFTKAEQLERLQGDLRAAVAQYEAEKERAFADALRRDRALAEYEQCVITAERSGIVIHPTGKAWENRPEIEEGATVHKDQVLLLMPDLTKMQVKVGIHESIIERVRPGLPARITLPERSLDGEVESVAAVTRPAGWWTGNVVKYDTIVRLPSTPGLKPGMTAEVEVVLARHEDVLMIPVTAVVDAPAGRFCWVVTREGVEKRQLQLGDSNEMFLAVESGVAEGEEIVLDPIAELEEARLLAASLVDAAESDVESPGAANAGDRSSSDLGDESLNVE
jgi:multidrug efflux pump subunit AcrA (membrane-fusion protein)